MIFEYIWEIIGITFATLFDVVSMSAFNASKMWRIVTRAQRAGAMSISLGPLKKPPILISLYPWSPPAGLSSDTPNVPKGTVADIHTYAAGVLNTRGSTY